MVDQELPSERDEMDEEGPGPEDADLETADPSDASACLKCGEEMYEGIGQCPKCGEPVEPHKAMNVGAWIILLLLLAGLGGLVALLFM
jgi:hypothetical protein